MITIERIRNVEIFQGLNDDELRIVSQFCREETVPREPHFALKEPERISSLSLRMEPLLSNLKTGCNLKSAAG